MIEYNHRPKYSDTIILYVDKYNMYCGGGGAYFIYIWYQKEGNK